MQRHLLHVFPSFNIGGLESRTSDIINHFGNRYRHTIVAMDHNFGCRAKLDNLDNIEFVDIPENKVNLLSNVQTFSRNLKRIKPDLLLTYNFGSIEWSLANAISNVCPELHWEDGFQFGEASHQFKRRIYIRRLFLARTRKIIVVSRQMQKIAKEIWRFSPKKIIYVPNGIDLAKYSSQQPSFPAELASCHGSFLIGTVARLREEKNIPRLIRAFRDATQNLDAKLIIVGEGEMYDSIKQYIQELNLTDKVIMTGFISDPSAIIRSLDVLAISSDTEQMPIAVLEGMAAGIPIVGTDVGDIREMVAPSNGSLICRSDDERAFAENLKRLILDRTLGRKIGMDNLARSKTNFDKQLMFANYEKLYELDI
jgi:L-malate glycosyltransferase